PPGRALRPSNTRRRVGLTYESSKARRSAASAPGPAGRGSSAAWGSSGYGEAVAAARSPGIVRWATGRNARGSPLASPLALAKNGARSLSLTHVLASGALLDATSAAPETRRPVSVP